MYVYKYIYTYIHAIYISIYIYIYIYSNDKRACTNLATCCVALSVSVETNNRNSLQNDHLSCISSRGGGPHENTK